MQLCQILSGHVLCSTEVSSGHLAQIGVQRKLSETARPALRFLLLLQAIQIDYPALSGQLLGCHLQVVMSQYAGEPYRRRLSQQKGSLSQLLGCRCYLDALSSLELECTPALVQSDSSIAGQECTSLLSLRQLNAVFEQQGGEDAS